MFTYITWSWKPNNYIPLKNGSTTTFYTFIPQTFLPKPGFIKEYEQYTSGCLAGIIEKNVKNDDIYIKMVKNVCTYEWSF